MAYLKTALFTLLVPGSFAGVLPWWLAHWRPLPMALGDWRWVGVVPAAIGGTVYVMTAISFAAARGTPAPIDPPKELVVRGLYRWVRNPMYVGVLVLIAGEALLYQAAILLLYVAALWTMFHSFVMFYEEPHLRKAFGESYERFLRDVPRWIPRRPRA